MAPLSKIPKSVIIGLVLAIVLDTVIQIFWKLAVCNVAENASIVATTIAALGSGYFYLAMVAFAAQLFNWLRVLAAADLSFAQPFTALSYITVLAISSFSLHEQIGVSRLSGVGLILVGVFLISRTAHNTAAPARATSTTGDGNTDG